MNKEELAKALDWTEDDLEELKQMKIKKANTLLLQLINSEDEDAAFILLFDKTLEINAQIYNDYYTPLLLAIKKGMSKLVIEAFTNLDMPHMFNINRKDLYENLAKSGSLKLYDFFESLTKNKKALLSSTLFYALGDGKLELIKHLINKKIDEQYYPVNLKNGIYGYSLCSDTDVDTYIEYFANLENYTENTYINEHSKKVFFCNSLLLRISTRYDINALELYKEIISPEQFIQDVEYLINEQTNQIKENKKRIVSAIKWLLVNSLNIDLTTNPFIRKGLEENVELIKFYDKIVLNKKLNISLEEKNNKNKTNKI